MILAYLGNQIIVRVKIRREGKKMRQGCNNTVRLIWSNLVIRKVVGLLVPISFSHRGEFT